MQLWLGFCLWVSNSCIVIALFCVVSVVAVKLTKAVLKETIAMNSRMTLTDSNTTTWVSLFFSHALYQSFTINCHWISPRFLLFFFSSVSHSSMQHECFYSRWLKYLCPVVCFTRCSRVCLCRAWASLLKCFKTHGDAGIPHINTKRTVAVLISET